MSLGKRHIGRRVAGVGVGVALMVLGLAAPAYAATTVTGFTPTSGPFGGGCVLDVTGTGFGLSPAANTTVNFVPPAGAAVPSGTVTIISDTELWATAPALANGTSYTIRVDNLQGTGTASTATFTAVTGAGTCGPTITSFEAPDGGTCGPAGTVVKITGTNLLDPTQSGGLVEFSPFVAGDGVDAANTNPDISDTVTLQVTVPTGAADGPISVTTFAGSEVFSSTAWAVPPPDCPSVTGNTHARSISFKIKSTGKASGNVRSTEDPAFTECVAAVPVKIQRKTSSGWKTVGKTTTTDTGSYAKKVKNPKGKQKFRALAPKVSLGDPVTDVCSKAKSAIRKV
jgi:IPT/TIG domain